MSSPAGDVPSSNTDLDLNLDQLNFQQMQEEPGAFAAPLDSEAERTDLPTDVAPTEVRPLAHNEKILTKLPHSLWTNMAPNLYDDDTDILYGQPLGSDVPPEKLYRASKNASVATSDWAMVYVRTSIKDTAFSAESQYASVVDMKAQDGRVVPGSWHDFRCVKQGWIRHTQVPGMFLDIKRSNDENGKPRSNVLVHIHVDHLARMKNGASRFYMSRSREGYFTDRFPSIPGILDSPEYDETGGWMETDFELNRDENGGLISHGKTPSPQELYFQNLEEQDRRTIKAIGDSVKSSDYLFDTTQMCAGDWVIYALMCGRDISVFRHYPTYDGAAQRFDNFRLWMLQAFRQVETYGSWPHYARQVKAQGASDLMSRHFRVAEALPPRQMVTKWRVTYEGKEPVGARPEEWTSFSQLKCFPSAFDKAFALRLGVERAHNHDLWAHNKAIADNDGRIQASWNKNVAGNFDKTYYFVTISLGDNEGNIFNDPRVGRPRVNTRITVQPVNTDYDSFIFEGTICQALPGIDAELCAILVSKNAKDQIKERYYNCSIKLELSSDSTSVDRQVAAIRELSRGVEDQKPGVDVCSLAFGTPPSSAAPLHAAEEFKASTNASGIYTALLEKAGLNAEQANCGKELGLGRSNTVALHGPPGTGKTLTNQTIAGAQILAARKAVPKLARRQVLACAPTNKATQEQLRKMVKLFNLSNRSGDDYIEAVLFTAGASRETKKPVLDKDLAMQDVSQSANASELDADKNNKAADAQNSGNNEPNDLARQSAEDTGAVEDIEIDDGLSIHEVQWEMLVRSINKRSVSGDLTDFLFTQKLYDYIKSCNNPTSAYQQESKLWLELRQSLVGSTLPKNSKREKRSRLRDLEYDWCVRFLRDQVDIVFCTNNASATPVLFENFEPSVLISDEAAFATLSDAITPMAAFKDHIRMVLLSGDHKQQGPPPLAKMANECDRYLAAPFFHSLYYNKDKAAPIQLVEQHRMRPAHSRMVSELWYEDTLKDHRSLVEDVSGVEVTIREAYSKLSKAWNGRLRFAVDVGGADVNEETFPGTTSTFNRSEATALVENLSYLLKFKPASIDAEILTPGHFMIISPYTMQCNYIAQMIAKKVTEGHLPREASKINIRTSLTAQSGEAAIVMLSLVRNKSSETGKRPTTVGFIKRSSQLCVNFSRAQIAQFTYGNWAAWAQQYANQHVAFVRPTSHHYKMGQVVFDHMKNGDILSEDHLVQLRSGQPVGAALGPFFKQAKPRPMKGLPTSSLADASRSTRPQPAHSFRRALVDEGLSRKKTKQDNGKGKK